MTRVLFVDDEPNILSGLRRMLRTYRKEWDMDFCSSGASALICMEKTKFDVVISDMRMPGMDGAEFLTKVRDRFPGTVRVVLSGHAHQELTMRSVGPAHQYLSKPCDAEQLKGAIQSVTRMQDLIKSSVIRDLVESIDTLPTLPNMKGNLVELIDSPDINVDQIADLIVSDVSMSAKVLQLVHSSFFGLPVKVTNVRQAVALLGLEVIKPLVLQTATFSQCENGENLGGFSLENLSDHSMEVGILARDIARFEGLSEELVGQSYLAGVLHDIGKIVLAKHDPYGYQTVRRQANGCPITEIKLENQTYAASHAEIGSYLLGLWGLPQEVIRAVTYHHQPMNSGLNVFAPVAAVYAAEFISSGSTSWDITYLNKIRKLGRSNAWEQLTTS